PQRPVVHVLEGYSHLLAGAIDDDVPKKLHAFAGRQILALFLARRFHVSKLRTERFVERIGTERAGMDRPTDELPEWFEILERSLVRIVVVRGRVMYVGGDPHDVVHARALDE